MIFEAHRGFSKHYPENTLLAFREAVRQGFDMIECDTKFTRDHKCVFFHDLDLDRLARPKDGGETERGTLVSSLTLDELRRYEVGSWLDPAFRGIDAPTLGEVIDFAERNPGVKFKIDNGLTRSDEADAEQVFAAVEKSKAARNFCFTVCTLDWAEKVVKRFPHNTLHYDGQFDEATLKELTSRVKPDELYIWLPIRKMSWLPYPAADREMMERVHKYGKIGLWIADREGDLDRVIELGADAVETDGTFTPSVMKR